MALYSLSITIGNVNDKRASHPDLHMAVKVLWLGPTKLVFAHL